MAQNEGMSALTMDLLRFPRSDFQDTHFTDFVIRCQSRTFHVHRLILGLRSENFRGIFQNPPPVVVRRPQDFKNCSSQSSSALRLKCKH